MVRNNKRVELWKSVVEKKLNCNETDELTFKNVVPIIFPLLRRGVL